MPLYFLLFFVVVGLVGWLACRLAGFLAGLLVGLLAGWLPGLFGVLQFFHDFVWNSVYVGDVFWSHFDELRPGASKCTCISDFHRFLINFGIHFESLRQPWGVWQLEGHPGPK